MPTMIKNNPTITMDLWLDINTLDDGLSNSQNFRYALTTIENSCTDGIVKEGIFGKFCS